MINAVVGIPLGAAIVYLIYFLIMWIGEGHPTYSPRQLVRKWTHLGDPEKGPE